MFYDDGITADRFLSGLGYWLRKHLTVRGVVQRNTFRRDRNKCDMELEELGSGRVFQLSRDRGKLAGGCRLDREAIVIAASVIAQGLESPCDLLIINKFGRMEAEGRGLREVIATAADREIPTIVGVPYRNSQRWNEFAGECSSRFEISDNEQLLVWIRKQTATWGNLFTGNEKIVSQNLFSEVA